MAFSVDAWGSPPVQPLITTTAAGAMAATPPAGVKPQLTPTQDIETNLVSKWLPVVTFPIFRQ